MNMKNIICLISFILLGIGCQKQNPHNKIMFKCVIFPTGMNSETYLIKMFEYGQLEVSYGIKTSDSEDEYFNKIINKKKITLSEGDFKIIKVLNSKLSGLNSIQKDEVRKGGWEIFLMSNGKKYHFYYGEYSSASLGLLIEQIIKISPIKLNLHSWS